ATPNDELVGILGLGYAAPALLPDPVQYYRDSFALMGSLGLRTFWSLGGGLESPTGGGWDNLDEAAGTGIPNAVLAGYGNGTRDAIQGDIKGRPTVFDFPLALSAPASVAAGGTIDYSLTTSIDLQALAQQILDERAKPLIEQGYGASLAATATVKLAFDHLTL